MNTATKIALFLAALAVIFGIALGVGSIVGPVGPAADPVEQPAQTEVDHGGMDMNDDN